MKKTLLFLIILLTIIIFPKANAKIVKIHDEEITSFNETLEGKIYRIGTPIKVNNIEYHVDYREGPGWFLGEFSSFNTEENNRYIGYDTYGSNMSEHSKYWKIDEIEYYSSYTYIKLIRISANYRKCQIEQMEIGDICYTGAEVPKTFFSEINYVDSEGQELGKIRLMSNSPTTFIGYTETDSLEDVAKAWKLKDQMFYGGSLLVLTFEPVEATEIRDAAFSLTCDKEKINYKDKTTCHINANNYFITDEEITINLEEKDDLELIKLIPSNYFSVENNNNTITVTPKYFSDTQENVELFSFEVQAKKEKNEIDNVMISNISYYSGETYTDLKTTINIENKNYLTSNPLTANPTLFKIILVSAFLISCTTLLIKRESV